MHIPCSIGFKFLLVYSYISLSLVMFRFRCMQAARAPLTESEQEERRHARDMQLLYRHSMSAQAFEAEAYPQPAVQVMGKWTKLVEGALKAQQVLAFVKVREGIGLAQRLKDRAKDSENGDWDGFPWCSEEGWKGR